MKVEPIKYGASYKSIANLAAGGVETIFSAAANVRGAILHRAMFSTYSASNQKAAILAKTSAPTTVTDGDVILGRGGPNSVLYQADLQQEIVIPAGKGLYYITDALESGASRSALYTLL